MSCAEKVERQFSELLRVVQVGEGLPGADQEGGFFPLDYDLTAAGPLNFPVGKAYGLYFPVANNPAGARLTADFLGGGQLTLSPGILVQLPFDKLTLSRHSTSVATGTARLQLFRTPRALVRGTGGIEAGGGAAGAGGSASISTLGQAYNSAANVPTVATDGLPLSGAKGARVLLNAGPGNTFNTGVGTVVLWYYSPDALAWFEGRTQLAIPNAGLRYIAFDDLQVAVPYGRIYAEVRSATHSGGAGSIASILEVL